MNPMQDIRIEKLTINIGVGQAGEKLDKAMLLISKLTNKKPIQNVSKKRIPTWGVRPGLAIGTKITLRKREAKEMLIRLLKAVENKLSSSSFDNEGNVSFGIKEYIDIPGIEYIIEVGIIGLETSVTLERPGFRIKKRKYMKKKLPIKKRILKEEAIEYMKKNFKIELTEEKK